MSKYSVLNVLISDASREDILAMIKKAIDEDEKLQIATVNNEFVVEAQKNSKFRTILNNSLSIADSTGIVWAVKHLHKKTIARIPGADLVWNIFNLSSLNKYRIYLLGGKKDTADLAKQKIIKRIRGVHIVGSIDGVEINPEEHNSELLRQINQSKPDIVLVALGAPKQELWISNNQYKIDANVFIGIGGTFDFISGKIRRAPRFLREIGLEWLYRLVVEPRRYKRIFKAVFIFPWLVLTRGKQILS
ncbi:MAG: WecB/TagA/CpsF family glycosyltransferase [Candidatus Berkelbacteria bacterium]|nr:WecB/TagA/CpsF family glycosyltransferase [Candidatus Berkelbacteria bacterium]